MDAYQPGVFISYAWGAEREDIVNKLDQSLGQRGIKIIRDKRDLGYRGSIQEFMERIGRGDCVIVVVSDKYLRSPNCMFELVEIAENKQFHDRIFPIVLPDANIYDPVKRLEYVSYWEAKRTELAEAMKKVDPANLQGIREDIDNYTRFREKISGLTSILKDMNTLTPEMHSDSDFEALYTAIEKRISEYPVEKESGFDNGKGKYPFFQASPAHLRRSFDAYMDDKLQNFVGRQFVFDALDEFLKTNSSGYFIIRGEPGMGKSSLMSKLIRDQGYIHHFNIASQNIRSPRAFLENICLQLIARYKLPYTSLPSNVGDDSGFLVQCLSEASKESNNHPVVLAIDSLDESDRTGLSPNVNTLYLPPSLPQGVYIVVTTRPLSEMRLQVSQARYFDLEPKSENNGSDIDTYTGNFIAAQEKMRAWLTTRNLEPKVFISAIRAKSQGNFMYLHHVLPAIAEGKFKKGTIDELPEGLLEYYRRHWREMREGREDEFKTIIKPIVCLLGVAKEPVTVDQIAAWQKVDVDDVKNYIGAWREFLIEGPPKYYRIYHASFQEYLRDEVGLEKYNTQVVDSIRSKILPKK